MPDASPTPPAALTPVSYIVLGMLAQYGPATSYTLKSWVDGTVGHFWSFPRSQLYAEPQRLVELGLLRAEQEPGGRRRRLFQVTEGGRAALVAWLGTPAGAGELRDPGLLRLYFAAQGGAGTVQAIAAEQLRLHQAQLDIYRRISADHTGAGGEVTVAETLRMGLLYEEASVLFWSGLQGGLPGDLQGSVPRDGMPRDSQDRM